MTDEPDLTDRQGQVLRALIAEDLVADLDPTEAGGLAGDELAQQLGVSEEEIPHDIEALVEASELLWHGLLPAVPPQLVEERGRPVTGVEVTTTSIGWAHSKDRPAPTAQIRRVACAKLVDRDGVLPDADRAEKAEDLRKAHMRRLATCWAKIRRLSAEGGGDGS